MKYIEVCFSNRMFLPSIPRLLRTIMEKEKKEKKMQKVSKLTPEKEKFHALQYIGKNISFFFLVWDKKRVD